MTRFAWARAGLLTLALTTVGPAWAVQPLPVELAPVCAQAPDWVPAASPRQPHDPLLRLVLHSGDAGTLAHGLKGQALDARRGTTQTTLLVAAAGTGNRVAVRQLLAAGASRDLRAGAGDGTTALEAAVLNARLGSTCELLAAGAQLPPPSQQPWLLPAAALSDDFTAAAALVTWLAAQGFDVNARMQGDTALHIAAELGNELLTRTLMAHGADAQAQNARGQTAVEIARAEGQTDLILLMEPSLQQRPHAPSTPQRRHREPHTSSDIREKKNEQNN